MTTAIISDIHGNLEALKAVFSDIENRKIDKILCLGDTIGYGPDPDLCLDIVYENCDLIILGNHEDAILNEPLGFYSLARESIKWTRKKLFPTWLRPWRTIYYKKILRSLSRSLHFNDCLLVHGSPRHPTMEYVLTQEFLMADETLVQELFSFEEHICFSGHTHIPAILSEKKLSFPAGEDKQEFAIGEDKLIINVGSVGQPRDHDPRACYVEFNGEKVVYHRIPYQIAETQKKIKKAGLDLRLADRLSYGM